MNISADDLIQAAAALLISATVVLFAVVIGNAFYAPEVKLAQNAYPIAIPERTEVVIEGKEPDVVEPIAPLLANADVDAGKRVAQACGACHNFVEGGANKVGPNLWNVFGAPIAGVDGFRYSNALSDMGGVWTVDALNKWLHHPKAFAAGTSMSYRGVRDAEDRANLVAYLRSLSANPAPPPAE